MQDTFVVMNTAMRPLEFEIALDVACDFADIFAVKDHDFALGDPMRADPLPDPQPGDVRLRSATSFSSRTRATCR